jgi:hypothetical protein
MRSGRAFVMNPKTEMSGHAVGKQRVFCPIWLLGLSSDIEQGFGSGQIRASGMNILVLLQILQ